MVRTLNLNDKFEYNNIEGLMVGFEKDRICFQLGYEFGTKIIRLKPEKLIINEDY